MFKILDRNYKQTFEDIMEEFPDSRFAVRTESKDSNSGYLLAISTDEESDREFHNYVVNDPDTSSILTGGIYATGDPFLITYSDGDV